MVLRRRSVRGLTEARQPPPRHWQRQIRSDIRRNEKPKFSTHSFGCHFVEVTWQPEIARLRVSRVVTVIDAGRMINPLAGRNQIEGAVVMGIGMALFEETTYDPQNGAPINSSLADYIMAVNADVAVDRCAFPRLSRQGDQRTWRAWHRRNWTGRRRRRHHRGRPSRDRSARARTAGEDRRSADLFRFGLTNERAAADHSARRRQSIASLGACHTCSDGRIDISKNGRSPSRRFGREHFRCSQWRLSGRGNWSARTKCDRRCFAGVVVV